MDEEDKILENESGLLAKGEKASFLLRKNITEISFKDLKKFSSVFWTLCFFMLTISPAYFLFINQLNTLIEDNFKVGYKTATRLSITVPTSLMFFVPLASYIADRKFNKSVYFLISSILGIMSFLLMQYVQGDNLILACILLASVGLYYSVFSSVIWSGGTQACPKELVDIGLAIMNTVQSIATFIFPILFVEFGVTTPGKLLPVLIAFNVLGFIAGLVLIFGKGKFVLNPEITNIEEENDD